MQIIVSGGISTIVPTVFGFVAGMLCVNLSKNELPDFVYSICGTLGKAFVDDAPAVMMARSVQRAGRSRRGTTGGQQQPRGSGNAAMAAPAVQQPRQPPAPPPEEAIEQLTSMGFDRTAVIRALEMSGNNVEAAANRLLSG